MLGTDSCTVQHDSCPTCRRSLIKTPESGSQENTTPASDRDPTVDETHNPVDILSILEHVLSDGNLTDSDGGRFIPNSFFSPRMGESASNLSNEYSAMYS